MVDDAVDWCWGASINRFSGNIAGAECLSDDAVLALTSIAGFDNVPLDGGATAGGLPPHPTTAALKRTVANDRRSNAISNDCTS